MKLKACKIAREKDEPEFIKRFRREVKRQKKDIYIQQAKNQRGPYDAEVSLDLNFAISLFLELQCCKKGKTIICKSGQSRHLTKDGKLQSFHHFADRRVFGNPHARKTIFVQYDDNPRNKNIVALPLRNIMGVVWFELHFLQCEDKRPRDYHDRYYRLVEEKDWKRVGYINTMSELVKYIKKQLLKK